MLRPLLENYDIARQICNYWCNFIRSGDPNGKDSTGEDKSAEVGFVIQELLMEW